MESNAATQLPAGAGAEGLIRFPVEFKVSVGASGHTGSLSGKLAVENLTNHITRIQSVTMAGLSVSFPDLIPSPVKERPTLPQPPANVRVGPADSSREFHVVTADLTEALNEFSRQANLQVIFDFNAVRGHISRPINGAMTPRLALETMLEGTGFEFNYVNDRTLAVTRRRQ